MANLNSNIVVASTTRKDENSISLRMSKREKIAMKYTIRSVIAHEFEALSVIEKGIMVLLIQSVLTQSIETGKSPSTFIKHEITPDFLNDLLSYFAEKGISNTSINCLTFKDIEKGCDLLFERSLNYHDYDNANHLMICQARLITAIAITPCPNNRNIIKGISIDVGRAILEELEAIINTSNQSLETALRLANHLVLNAEPTRKLIN